MRDRAGILGFSLVLLNRPVMPAARVNKPDFLTEISKERAYMGLENLRRVLYNNVYPRCQGNFVGRFCANVGAELKVVPPARFQRATFRLGGGRSMQLSYGSTK